MIAVVDYGMGNLRSVAKAIEHVAPKEIVTITSDAAQIRAADRVVFPGQGAMPDCMRYLGEYGLDDAVREAAASKPLLAVCIGEQMLFERSEEGDVAGLGIFGGTVVRFRDEAMRRPDGQRLKVPHMGWNRVWFAHPDAPVFAGIEDGSYFYFLHSFYPVPVDSSVVAGWSEYGVRFAAAIQQDRLFATQFHPEKSGGAGVRLYANFLQEAGLELRPAEGAEAIAGPGKED
jgi:glutamine amidotransferase